MSAAYPHERLVLTFFLTILVLVGPFWLYLPALVLGVFYLLFFWEGILIALLVDMLYGHGNLVFFGIPTAFGVSILVLLAAVFHRNVRVS